MKIAFNQEKALEGTFSVIVKSLRTFVASYCQVRSDDKRFLFPVERRRRFNINDRIKDLGAMLPKKNEK